MSSDVITIRTENKVRSLIARQDFKRGDVIYQIPSEKISDKPNRFTVQMSRDLHTEVGKLSALNHSCDPNVLLDMERMLVIANRDIQAGDELSFFYPSTEWEMAAPFICLCGSPRCIHVVAGARFLPLSTLEHHYLNRHIREMIVEMLDHTQRHLPEPNQA
ncbi:MAG: SET domain-containing protein-lysine N-methyltransferase [Chloroflexota bacterium]